MLVTATELKNNLNKYLSLVSEEDIFITQKGKNVAKLSSTKPSKVDIVKSLIGAVPNSGITLEEARKERLSRYESAD
jgi:prevent-host-death family protein